MSDDLWTTIDLPILKAIADVDAGLPAGSTNFNDDVVIENSGTGIDRSAYLKSLERLGGAGYIDVTVHRAGGGVMSCWINGVMERGRRATDQWPPDDAYLNLLEVLRDRIEGAPDEETKGRLRGMLDGFMGAGRDLGVDLAAEWLKRITMG